MIMKNKSLIRAVVIAGVLAWPALETYRLVEARQQASASTQLERAVTAQLRAVKGEAVAAVAPPVKN